MNKYLQMAKTLEEVNSVYENIKSKEPELAKLLKNEVILRKTQILLPSILKDFFDPKKIVEKLAICVAYYEAELHQIHGRRRLATRVRNCIARYGWIAAAERICINGNGDGFRKMMAAGLYEYTWERVILENKEFFSKEAVVSCQARLASV